MPDTTTTPPVPVQPTALAARSHRKERVGEVLASKMTKTIIVRVERRFPHPKFKKVITGYKVDTGKWAPVKTLALATDGSWGDLK